MWLLVVKPLFVDENMKYRDVTYRQFIEETRKKKIICIGAGKLLEDIFDFWDKEIIDRIEIIADNYKSKSCFCHEDYSFKICSVDELRGFSEDEYAVLITTMFCDDIVKQLFSLDLDSDLCIYIYSILSMRTDDYAFPNNAGAQIPKKIHWMWVGNAKIPDKLKRCVDSWYKHCPDYEIILWNEENYDISKCCYMQEAYKKGKYGFVPDYARLDIVYNEGGFYLDTDVELIRSLDDLLGYSGVIGFQRNFQINLGHGFGAKPFNSLIKSLMDSYENRVFSYELESSPMIQTRELIKHGLKCDNRLQIVDDVIVFPCDVFDPKGTNLWDPIITKRTHGVHHYSETWVNMTAKEKEYEMFRQTGLYRNFDQEKIQ